MGAEQSSPATGNNGGAVFPLNLFPAIPAQPTAHTTQPATVSPAKATTSIDTCTAAATSSAGMLPDNMYIQAVHTYAQQNAALKAELDSLRKEVASLKEQMACSTPDQIKVRRTAELEAQEEFAFQGLSAGRPSRLRTAGYSCIEAKAAGYSYADVRAAGYSQAEAAEADYAEARALSSEARDYTPFDLSGEGDEDEEHVVLLVPVSYTHLTLPTICSV